MNCECNNNSNRVKPRIKHVYGNVLRMAIPLTLRSLVKDGDEMIVNDTDFIPSSDHPVRVVFSKGKTNYPITATMDGNVAIIEDKGKIPVGTYDISVECYDDLGNPYRFKQNAVLYVADTTAEAGIDEEIEYEAQTWYLNAAVFLATTEIGEIGDVIDAKLDDVFGNVLYDANAKEIRFYNKGNSRVLATIDSRPFVVDGTVADVYIDVSRQVLVVVLNEDAGGRRFSVPLYLVFNSYYKKDEVDSLVSRTVEGVRFDFSQELPFVVHVTQDGSSFSSDYDFGAIGNAIMEDDRVVVACVNNTAFLQLLVASGEEIIFSQVFAEDSIQTLLRLNDRNEWSMEDVDLGTGGGGGGYEPPAGGIPKSDLAQSVQDTLDDVANKVDKESGKSLMTDAERTKLAGIAAGAEVNVQADWNATSGDAKILNKPDLSTFATKTELAGKQNTLTSSTTLMTINGNAVHYGESVTVQGEKGDKGDTGDVQVDGNGNVLIYNGRDKTTTGAALDASQGQFIGKILNAKDNTFYNVWVGTANDLEELEALEGYEDNTIYLVGVEPTIAQRFNVTFSGGDHTSVPASTPQTVKEGSPFSVVVSPASGYTIDTATGTMVGGTLTKTNNQDGTVTFSTSAVTGAITITAAATKHITGITVSAGTRSGNSIPLTAVVTPSGAENVTLAWSVNDTTNFGISGSGASATLTVKSGASNSSVTITCQDTNASSGTASGTLQLTGLSYADVPIPVTEITDITATRTAANTLTLEATADGNTPITFSIVGTAPKSKKLNYNNSPATLEEVDSVVLSGDTLSYKEDCKVTIQASAENGTVTFQKEITIEHNNADAIWFEDEVTLAALNSNSVGSGGKVTYTQAAAVTALKFLAGNTSIRRFKEFMWFTGITGLGVNSSDKSNFKGCSNLECLGIPMGTSGFYTNATASSNTGLTGCNLKEIHVRNIDDIFSVSHWNSSGFSSFYYAGRNNNGLGLYVDNAEVTDIVVPSTMTIVGQFKFAGFNRITSFTAHDDVTTIGNGVLAGCAALTSIKIGNGLTSFGTNMIRYNQAFGYITTLNSVDLGTACSSLDTQCFRGCTGLRTITLRYDGVVTQDNSFYQAASMSSIDLYVPANQVSAYQAASPWSGAKSINAIEE